MTSNGSFFSELGIGPALVTQWQTLIDEANAAAANATAANSAIQASVGSASASASSASTSSAASASSATAAATSATNAATSATNAASSVAFVSNPNILLNGCMEVDQANEGATIAANGFFLDGWTYSKSSTATTTAQRVADGPLTYPKSAKLTTTTGVAVAAGHYLGITQNIEAANVADLAWGTASAQSVALSFWVKASIASYVMSVAIRNAATDRSYVANVTVTSPNTWERKTVIIPGPTTGTWPSSGSSVGLSVSLMAAVGSTFQTTAGAWQAGNFLGTSSNTNTVLSTNSATFQVTAVKFEVGTAATAYSKRDAATEMLVCQRYYRKSYEPGTALGTVTVNGCLYAHQAGLTSSTNNKSIGTQFFPPMRASPTMTYYSPATGASAKARDVINAADTAAPSTLHASMTGFEVGVASTSATTICSFEMHYVADARL